MLIKAYRTSGGRSPVEDCLRELPQNERDEIYALLEDLKEYGLSAPLVSMRQIRGKLWELRISRHRIFYVMADAEVMVLLHAYKKQGRKAPIHEIETALRRMKVVLEGESNDEEKAL